MAPAILNRSRHQRFRRLLNCGNQRLQHGRGFTMPEDAEGDRLKSVERQRAYALEPGLRYQDRQTDPISIRHIRLYQCDCADLNARKPVDIPSPQSSLEMFANDLV